MADWDEQGASVLPKLGTSRSKRILAPAILLAIRLLLARLNSPRTLSMFPTPASFLRQEEESQS